MNVILGLIITVLVAFITIPLNGWVLTKLWAWFIIPTFHLPALTIPVACGIALTISYLTHQVDKKTIEQPFADKLIQSLSTGIAKPLVSLLFGYLITLFL